MKGTLTTSPSRSRATTAAVATVVATLLLSSGVGCATKNKPADLPLSPRNRMSYDAETTVQMAVASRLENERRNLAAMLATQQPTASTTRPAVIEVPAPQLIPAPTAAGGTLSQGVSTNPLQAALATVAGANEQATRVPTPEGFLNAVHYYDYAPGVRYNAVAAGRVHHDDPPAAGRATAVAQLQRHGRVRDRPGGRGRRAGGDDADPRQAQAGRARRATGSSRPTSGRTSSICTSTPSRTSRA